MISRFARDEPDMHATTSFLRPPRGSLLAMAIGLALSAPTAACNLDGMTGPGHGGFGGWGRWMAQRHGAEPSASAGNADSGERAGATYGGIMGGDEPEEDEAAAEAPVFVTLPGPSVEIRESGDTTDAEWAAEEEPIDLKGMR